MSISCENIKTTDRAADEARFLDEMRGGFTNKKITEEVIDLSEYDNINHPAHYNNSPSKCECGRRIECIDVTRHLPFNIGNAMKYLWRCELKGNTIEDLKKASWYINDEIAKRSK